MFERFTDQARRVVVLAQEEARLLNHHDIATEQPVAAAWQVAEPGSILLLDGIFLHRPELVDHWDYSVFLDVPFTESVARMAGRDHGDPDPAAATNHRYVAGQQLYLAECRPSEKATVVIDNSALLEPRIRRRA